MWVTEDFNNESDVEQKLIAPFLFSGEGLQYPSHQVKTKEYIRDCSIGKRKSRRGHVPDYLLYAYGLPCVAIEAKSPSDTLDEALQEASQYALEINRSFPHSVNPLQTIVACNGIDILVAPWDAVGSAELYPVSDLLPGLNSLEKLQKSVSYGVIKEAAAEARKELAQPQWYNPLRLAGGTPVQGRTRPLNKFGGNLAPLMIRFLAKDQPRDSEDIIRRAYVETEERTEYERTLESLLRDNLARKLRPDAVDIRTEHKNIRNPQNHFIPAQEGVFSATTTLLIGGVGSGKSIFLDRFRQCYMSDEIATNVLWTVIDFNDAPDSASEYRDWIYREFVKAFAKDAQQQGVNIYSLDMLKKLFGSRIAQKKHILYGGIGGLNDEDFERKIRELIDEWSEQSTVMVEGIYAHFRGEQQRCIYVVFDNADKRTSEQQVAVFQEALSFGATHSTPILMAMRDETYDIYANRPPLDAVSKHRIFRVAAPRLIDVVKKRLSLMSEYIEKDLPDKLEYSQPNGVVIQYPKSELRSYLDKVYNDLFASHRTVRMMLESVAGRNIRKALEMFIEVLGSPYLSEYQVGLSGKYRDKTIPEWVVIRALMRGRYCYYSDLRKDVHVANIFQVNERSKSVDNYLLPEILAILVRERKRTGDLGVEGYKKVEYIYSAPELMGYADDDVLWALRYALQHGMIISDSANADEVSEESYVKVTASGYFHLQYLSRRIEYLSNVAMSTWVRHRKDAERIMGSMHTHDEDKCDRFKYVEFRFKILANYMRHELERHRNLASADDDRLAGSNKIVDSLHAADHRLRGQ